MNVMLLGNGGREHALAWKFAQSSICDQLYIAPGNAGTGNVGINLPEVGSDFEKIKMAVLNYHIDLVVVGPEAPLVDGIVDYFLTDPALQEVDILGPDKRAAQLEGSKSFAKDFMLRHGIPTAKYFEVTEQNLEAGIKILESMEPPFVLKADGLAAGKGVLIIDQLEEAKAELSQMIGGKFGDASAKVVIEEFLDGIEFSVFALVDGERFVMLPEAKDYKRIGEGDTGLNTGGMGSVSPVPFYTQELEEKVIEKIVKPTVLGFKKDNLRYRGFVFFGLILVEDQPMVIEYNCRMGDPETQSVMARLDSDLLPLCASASKGALEEVTITTKSEAVCTLVAVSGGYPEKYEKGKVITGVEEVEDLVFIAGAIHNESNALLTNGGRVLAVTAYGDSIDAARKQALQSMEKISFEGKNFRTDIGKDVI